MCVKIFEITGSEVEGENCNNLSVVLYEKAPLSLRREAVITFGHENIRNHRKTKIKSYHRLVFDQDWSQLIDFFNFLLDPAADDQPIFAGMRFLIQQRPHQPGCFQIYCDPATTFRKLPDGCELWMEMDLNPYPENSNHWLQDPLHPGRTLPVHDHWVLLKNSTLRSIVALNVEVMDFFKTGLGSACHCIPNKSFNLVERCEKDPSLDSNCRCERCV